MRRLGIFDSVMYLIAYLFAGVLILNGIPFEVIVCYGVTLGIILSWDLLKKEEDDAVA